MAGLPGRVWATVPSQNPGLSKHTRQADQTLSPAARGPAGPSFNTVWLVFE